MPAFTNILIRQGVISKEQLAHAEEVAREQAIGVGDALDSLGYASGEQVMRAVAEEHNLEREAQLKHATLVNEVRLLVRGSHINRLSVAELETLIARLKTKEGA